MFLGGEGSRSSKRCGAPATVRRRLQGPPHDVIHCLEDALGNGQSRHPWHLRSGVSKDGQFMNLWRINVFELVVALNHNSTTGPSRIQV